MQLPEPKITYEIRQEGIKREWVVRRQKKLVKWSKFDWRAWKFASDRARNEAVRSGISVLVWLTHSDGSVREFTWTPESARENIAAVREICRRALGGPSETE
jgi:hypothetical protein